MASACHLKKFQIFWEKKVMVDSKLGTKQLCPNCEAKFYDLNKRPAVCPKCGTSFEPDEEEILSIREKVKAKTPVPTTSTDDEDEAEEAVTVDEDEEEETVAELGTESEDVIVTDVSDDEDDGGKTVPAGFSEQGVDDDTVLDDDDDEFDIDAALEETGDVVVDDEDGN